MLYLYSWIRALISSIICAKKKTNFLSVPWFFKLLPAIQTLNKHFLRL